MTFVAPDGLVDADEYRHPLHKSTEHALGERRRSRRPASTA